MHCRASSTLGAESLLALFWVMSFACVSEPEEGGKPPPASRSQLEEGIFEIRLTSQPGGQGELISAVKGIQEPGREAGRVVISFASGATLEHDFEAEGQQLRMRIRGTVVQEQTVEELPPGIFASHVAATAMAVQRYHRWFLAAAEGERLYGAGNLDASVAYINVVLHQGRDDVAYCADPLLERAQVYGVTQTACEPERPQAPSAIDDCYGADYGQDFRCSVGAPQEAWFFGQRVDTRECCLEHDRAFWCGGTRMDGTVPAGSVGSFLAWEAANSALVNCQLRKLHQAYVQELRESPWWTDIGVALTYPFVMAAWATYWAAPGAPFMWFAAGEGFHNQVRSPFESDEEWQRRVDERNRIISERQSSCLCGGDRAVPLCGQRCRLNTCSLPAPQVLTESAFTFDEAFCPPGGECIWVCEEKTEDGVPIARQWRTAWQDRATGQVQLVSCQPDYQPTCACEPLSQQVYGSLCGIVIGEEALHLSLPGLQEDGELLPIPEGQNLGTPHLRPPPYIRR